MRGARETNERGVLEEVRWSDSARSVIQSRTAERDYHNRRPGGGSRRADALSEEHQAYLPSSVAQAYHIGPERDSQAG